MYESDSTGLSSAELAAAFNIVYADYAVPFTMTEAAARRHVAAHAIAPDRSILWRDDAGEVVGLAALGVRGERGWVGGFGLAPAWRGRGLSGVLLGQLLDRAREAGLRRVQLEVITTNARAIRTYERAGFGRARELLILASDEAAPAEAGANDVREGDPATLLVAPPIAVPTPAWQREPASLAADPDLRGLVLGDPASPRAFVVYSATAIAVQIGALAGVSADALAALTRALASRLPGRSLRLANEPEESLVPTALLAASWRETLRQYEMICAL